MSSRLLRPERLVVAVLAATGCFLLGRGQPLVNFDEHRVRGAAPLRLLAAGDVRGAFDNAVTHTSGRPGLPLAYLPTSIASWCLGGERPPPSALDSIELDETDVATARVGSALWVAAAVLLAGALAERLRDRGAGLLAAGGLGASVAVLHHGRTLMPTAVTLAATGAFALVYLRAVAAAGRNDAPRAATTAGVALGATFLVYPGAYPLLGAFVAADVLAHRLAARERVSRVALGALAVLLAAEGLYRLILGGSVCSDLWWLGGTIRIGDPAEGWSFAWEYLWRCDRALGVVALAGALTAPRVLRGEGRLVGLALVIVVVSQTLVVTTLLHRQVLYGRLVAPWLALAWPLAAAVAPRTSPRVVGMVLAVVVLHQLPAWELLARVPIAEHPAAAYEGLNPAERAARAAAIAPATTAR